MIKRLIQEESVLVMPIGRPVGGLVPVSDTYGQRLMAAAQGGFPELRQELLHRRREDANVPLTEFLAKGFHMSRPINPDDDPEAYRDAPCFDLDITRGNRETVLTTAKQQLTSTKSFKYFISRTDPGWGGVQAFPSYAHYKPNVALVSSTVGQGGTTTSVVLRRPLTSRLQTFAATHMVSQLNTGQIQSSVAAGWTVTQAAPVQKHGAQAKPALMWCYSVNMNRNFSICGALEGTGRMKPPAAVGHAAVSEFGYLNMYYALLNTDENFTETAASLILQDWAARLGVKPGHHALGRTLVTTRSGGVVLTTGAEAETYSAALGMLPLKWPSLSAAWPLPGRTEATASKHPGMATATLLQFEVLGTVVLPDLAVTKETYQRFCESRSSYPSSIRYAIACPVPVASLGTGLGKAATISVPSTPDLSTTVDGIPTLTDVLQLGAFSASTTTDDYDAACGFLAAHGRLATGLCMALLFNAATKAGVMGVNRHTAQAGPTPVEFMLNAGGFTYGPEGGKATTKPVYSMRSLYSAMCVAFCCF